MELTVKIKTWDAMEREFEINGNIIYCQLFFVKQMEEEIPKDRIIKVEKIFGNNVLKWFKPDRRYWNISEDMIDASVKDYVGNNVTIGTDVIIADSINFQKGFVKNIKKDKIEIQIENQSYTVFRQPSQILKKEL